jgi:hypothetical protein
MDRRWDHRQSGALRAGGHPTRELESESVEFMLGDIFPSSEQGSSCGNAFPFNILSDMIGPAFSMHVILKPLRVCPS